MAPNFDPKTFSKVFVAGHRGMVGSAVLRAMKRAGLPEPLVASRSELDLTDQRAVFAFFEREKPSAMIMAAAKVGGIEANRQAPADFLYLNLAMAANTIEAAYRAGVGRVLYLGSSCIYPRLAPQPMTEDALLTGPLEQTNEGYAIAKIAGMKMCQFYRRQHGVMFHSAMPTNLYGPGDNYDLNGSHVLPAMIRKFETARETGAASVGLWGTGSAIREFLHVDDLAEALLFLLAAENPPDWANVGSGREVTIRELAGMVRDATGAACEIEWDATKPDGTPRKLLDCSLLRGMGWTPRIDLEEGIARTVAEYRSEKAEGRLRAVRI